MLPRMFATPLTNALST
ncbi:hypothetical protein LINGRAHAP2_LOCUS16303 [Linum grandiflorum]